MTVEEYVEIAKKAMQYWIDVHFDFDKWVEHWFPDDIIENLNDEWGWKVNIITDIYSLHWDIMELVVKVIAQSDGWVECPECYEFDLHETYCGCETNPRPMPAWEVEERLGDADVSFDYWGEEPIRKALLTVWNDYLGQTHPFTQPIREDIEANLAELDNPTPEAVAWANHLMHVSGHMIADYGEIDMEVIQAISEQGLAYFEGESNGL